MTEFDPPFEVVHPSQQTVVFVDDEAERGMMQAMTIHQLKGGCAERGLALRVYIDPLLAKEFIEGNDHGKIIMLTDNNMDGMSGRELIYALEEKGKLPQTVLLSGLTTDVGGLPTNVLALDKAADGRRAVKEVFSRVEKLTKVDAPSITPAAASIATNAK